MSRAVLDSSPVVSTANLPPRPLKRSASTASLPTPPQTIQKKNRFARSLSRGSDRGTDSETDGDEESTTRPVFHPERRRLQFGYKRQRTDRLDAVVESLSGEDADNPFWDGPSADTNSEGGKERSPSPEMLKRQFRAPVSPPPSRRQSSTSKPLKMETLAKPILKEERATDPVRDSPNNPFLSDSPGSVYGEPIEPRTPTEHTERPTISYVFRGVRTEFANPLYNLSPSVKSRSLLPIEHPDFSPDPTCPPKILFPEARRNRRNVSPTPSRSSRSTSKQVVGKALSESSNGWDEDDSDNELEISPPKRLLFRAPS